MILAGTSERGVCVECGAPWVREVEVERGHVDRLRNVGGRTDGYTQLRRPKGASDADMASRTKTLGWQPSCECFGDGRDGTHVVGPLPIPATILDPFSGSGTSLLVARQLGRHALGVELNERYCAMTRVRLAQLSLLAEGAA